MMQGDWRLRVARWLAPTIDEVPVETSPSALPTDDWVRDAWAQVCEQFALRMLVLAEQLRPALDQLEGDEDDPDRLQWLYLVDHGLSRMRRAARDLRVLAGSDAEEIAGDSSSLLEVIRAAASAIEHYGRVSVGAVVELGVVAYAAEDIASLLAVLADNGTRYSPSTVRISAHLLGDGAVMVRIEDSGIGIEPDRLAAINAALAGPVPEVGVYTGRHTGFPVAHRLACKHGLEIRLACRPVGRSGADGSSGTVAMVTIPPSLVCEIPEQAPAGPNRPRHGISLAHGMSQRAIGGNQPDHRLPPVWPVPAEVAPSEPLLPVTRSGLPRREPGSARNAILAGRSVSSRSDTPDPAAAGQSFAADVAAFTAGNPALGWRGAGEPVTGQPITAEPASSGQSVPNGAGHAHYELAEGQIQ
jgi:hypothetical protein